jgi:hypothetical protein
VLIGPKGTKEELKGPMKAMLFIGPIGVKESFFGTVSQKQGLFRKHKKLQGLMGTYYDNTWGTNESKKKTFLAKGLEGQCE